MIPDEIEGNEITDVWAQYEKGKNFNRKMGLYTKARKHEDFYHGNQWRGLQVGKVNPIVLNIIKPTVKYKVGVVNSNIYQIMFNINTYQNADERKKLEELCRDLTKYVNKIWENKQVGKKVRSNVKDACIDSEGIIYFYDKDGEIEVEEIDKTNIYYGNENDDDIQSQPYIILSFRKPLDSVIEEAKENKVSAKEIENIFPDDEYTEQSGADKRTEEITPMVLVLLKLYKKNGTVHFKKCTKTATIKEETDTKLKLYPVAHIVWEKVKGYSRGLGEVEYLIGNQIEINKTATRRAVAVKLMAFPKLVANTKYISNTEALEQTGTTIELNEMGADDVTKVVNYLKPVQMSTDAYNLQKELIDDTQNLAGAGDVVNGKVDPTQASGKAILAVQQASQQPLSEQVETFKTFIEDIGRICFDMIQTYSTNGITLTREEKNVETGQTEEIVYQLSYKELIKLKPNIKIDITPTSAFDKYARELSLENLMLQQKISFEEYVKALPEDSTMPKVQLEQILKDREELELEIRNIEKQATMLDGAFQQAMAMQEMQNQGIEPNIQQNQEPNNNRQYETVNQGV